MQTNRWYKLADYNFGDPIIAVDVVKETGKTIVWLDRRFNKAGSETRTHKNGQFFKSLDEAKAKMTARLEAEIERLKENIHSAQSRLGQVKSFRGED